MILNVIPVTLKRRKSCHWPKEIQLHDDEIACHICVKKFSNDQNYGKVKNHCYYTGEYRDAAHSTSNLRFNISNKITVVSENESNYDYHFIIKELENKFKGQFECLEDNIQKYKNCSVRIKEETRKVDKNGNEDTMTISYKIKSINGARFMSSSLSDLVNNLAEGIHEFKCKDYDYFLEHESAKDDLVWFS